MAGFINSRISQVASKAIGIAGAAVVLLDANAMGVRKADENSKNAIATYALRQQVGLSKMDTPSPLYNELRKGAKANFPHTLIGAVHGVTGYFKGLFNGIESKLPLMAFSTLAIAFSKNKVLGTVGAVGAGVTALWGYIKNTTTLFENKKYLD